MAYSTTWNIENMQRETSDGYVFEVGVSLTGTDTSDASIKGQTPVHICKLVRPSGSLVPYADLTEATVTGWVQNVWSNQLTMPTISYKTYIETQLEDIMSHNKTDEASNKGNTSNLPWS